MASTSPRNHWWHVTLYVSARGLTTRRMHANGGVAFEIDFDFIDHRLVVATNRGEVESFELVDGLSVAEFDAKLHATLAMLGIDVAIREQPFRVPVTTQFPEDREHASYDRAAVEHFWHILEWTDEVWRSSQVGIAERPVPFTSSGTRSTLRSPASAARAHPLSRSSTSSIGRRIRTRWSRSASGPGMRTCASPPTTRTRLLNPRTFGSSRCTPVRRTGRSTEAARSRSCPMTRYGRPRTRGRRCSRSSRARTGQAQHCPVGIRRGSSPRGVRPHRSSARSLAGREPAPTSREK